MFDSILMPLTSSSFSLNRLKSIYLCLLHVFMTSFKRRNLTKRAEVSIFEKIPEIHYLKWRMYVYFILIINMFFSSFSVAPSTSIQQPMSSASKFQSHNAIIHYPLSWKRAFSSFNIDNKYYHVLCYK